MDKKKIRHFFEGLFLYPLTILVLGFIKISPLFLVLANGRFLGWLAYVLFYHHRKVAYETINTALNRGPKETKRIVRQSFINFGEILMETLYSSMHKVDVNKRIKIVGEEHLLAAIEKDKGVVCVSAHLGCFSLAMYALQTYGIKTNMMLRPLRSKFFGKIAKSLMDGCDVISIFSKPAKKAIFQSLKALKKKELLMILMDQNFGTGGVWVDFFGKLAATATGAVVLGARSGATILPMHMIRDKSGRHTLKIEPEFELKHYDNPDQMILENVALLTKKIEGWITEYPEIWSWMHKRWKSRPDKKDLKVPYRVQGND